MRRGKGSDPVPPYGVAIQRAIAAGDLNRMKAVARAAECHLEKFGDVSSALEALKAEIAKWEVLPRDKRR